MGEVIEIENAVTMKNIRKVHLMSNKELSEADLRCYLPPSGDGARINITREAGVWHLRAEWLHNGLVDVRSEYWPKPKRMVVRALKKGDRISEKINDAAREFLRLFGVGPQYVFIRRLPKGVEDGMVIMFMGWEMILIQCEWIIENCVAAGGVEVQSGECEVTKVEVGEQLAEV